MKLKHGYDYDTYFSPTYEVVDDSHGIGSSGEAEIDTVVNNVRTGAGRGSGYGTTIHLEDGEIVAFTIKSYDIEVKIPATSEMHNKIYELLHEE